MTCSRRRGRSVIAGEYRTSLKRPPRRGCASWAGDAVHRFEQEVVAVDQGVVRVFFRDVAGAVEEDAAAGRALGEVARGEQRREDRFGGSAVVLAGGGVAEQL